MVFKFYIVNIVRTIFIKGNFSLLGSLRLCFLRRFNLRTLYTRFTLLGVLTPAFMPEFNSNSLIVVYF